MDSITFGQKLKKELLSRIAKKAELKRAQLFGMLFACDERSNSLIGFSTENEGVIAVFSELVSDVFGILPELSVVQRKDDVNFCRAQLTESSDILDINAEFFIEDGGILRDIQSLSRDEISFFICGAYLVCGSIIDPRKSYQLEFTLKDKATADDFCQLLNLFSINAAVTMRKKQHIVYLKQSEAIEDLLIFMGAKLSALELMDVKIYKELRNNTNRRTNCETANIGKTVAASAEQIADIKLIFEKGGRESLPENLRELALLRLENPDMSLSDLGKRLAEPISRSGVNHRFEKIKEIAQKYR